jgi:hypothetical protein
MFRYSIAFWMPRTYHDSLLGLRRLFLLLYFSLLLASEPDHPQSELWLIIGTLSYESNFIVPQSEHVHHSFSCFRSVPAHSDLPQ